MKSTTIGFIGLGMMGNPMVNNLLKRNFSVFASDINADAGISFKGVSNFEFNTSPLAIANSCNVIILMLPNSSIIDQLLWEQGFASSLTPNTLLIDMSSSKPTSSKENARKLKALGIHFVDAPVSGGVKRAVDATLAIMVGGEESAVKLALPILEALGKNIIHVGQVGAGHAVKALNNYVSASGLLAVCEALVAAKEFGIDPHLVNQVFNASSGKNNTTEVKVESFMLSETYASGFSMALMRKDLQTALEFIKTMETHHQFSEVCLQTWINAEGALQMGADHTEMFDYIQKFHDGI